MFILLTRLARLLCTTSLLLLILCSVGRAAAEWDEPARELSSRIAAATGPGAVALEVTNRSSLGKIDVDAIRAALRSQLGMLGIRFVNPEQAAATMQVTLSENLRHYVWVAQVQQGTQSAVAMISMPRLEPPPPVREPAVLLIRKIQLWTQDVPILDVGVIDTSPPKIIVLDPDKITLYGLQGGKWQQEQAFPITHTRPWPRDVRGRIILRKDHLFDAYLPGGVCSSTAAPPLAVSCHPSDDPWPLGIEQASLGAFFSPTRNFFTGALAPGIGKDTTLSPFYSAVPIPKDKYVLWLFAATDGQYYELDGVSRQTLSRPAWGSDLASVKTNCGSGWQILATSSGDGTTPDTVRAFEFPDRDPVPVSQAMEFSGAVTALWSESGGTGAVVVARSLQTERYDAFRLAITCGQ